MPSASGMRRSQDGSYSARVSITGGDSRRFSKLTGGFSKMAERGFVSGFHIDSIVASLFDAGLAQLGMNRVPVSILSKFGNYLTEGTNAMLVFSPGEETKAEVVNEDNGEKIGEVSMRYGNPGMSKARLVDLENMPGMGEHFISAEMMAEYARLTRAQKGAYFPVPMLALSHFSKTLVESVGDAPKVCLQFVNMGPLQTWGYAFVPAERGKDGLDELADIARACFTKGNVIYHSHSARFFRAAYGLKPEEPFRIFVDYTGLKPVRNKKTGEVAGLKGLAKGDAMFEDGNRLFEATAQIYASMPAPKK